MANRRPAAILARLHSGPGRAVSVLTAFALTFSSGAGLFTRLAHAGDLPRVLVLPYAPIYETLPAETGAKTAALLEAELRNSEQLQLIALDPAALAPAARPVNPTPARDDAKLAEARERVAKADDLLKKLKFKPAADEYEKVIALFEAQHPYIDFTQLSDAYLDLAVAYFRLGQDDEGEKLLAHVVRLDPERKLDTAEFPPIFVRVFDNVAKKVKNAPRAALRVEPSAPGARVSFDGREVGVAPVLIKDVIKGVHYVRLEPAEGEAWADRVELAAGESARLAPELGGTAGPHAEIASLMSRNVIDDLVAAKAAALAEKAGAEYVVLGGVHKEKETIVVSSHLMRVSSRKLCLLQRVVFDSGMLGAGIEVYKIGADIAGKVELFGDLESLPTKVARDALPGSGAAAVAEVTSTGDKVEKQVEGRPSIVLRNAESGPKTVAVQSRPEADVRRITAAGEPELQGQAFDPLERPGTVEEDKNLTWLWVVLGVIVVGGAATGGYLYYDAANQPITGSGPVTW